mgnify:CR=1 FL=1
MSESEYRTIKDIWKEIADSYVKLGNLLDEANRMFLKGMKK